MVAVAEEIRTVLGAYADALRDGDVEAVLRCFSEHAVVMAPSAPTAVGVGVRALYGQILQSVKLDIEFTVDLVVEAEDRPVAFTHSDGTQTGADGVPAEEANRESFVFTRRDEELTISHYLFNTVG